MPYHTFAIGWPHKELSPNGRPKSHFSTAKHFKAQKLEAWGAALASGVGKSKVAHIHFTFHPKAKGPPPDKDNAIASVKAAQDGIALALGIDDRYITTSYAISHQRFGRVVINVSTDKAAQIPLKGCIG